MEHLAKRSGVNNYNPSSNINLNNIVDIDLAPEIAIAIIVHVQIYNRTIKGNKFSLESLLKAFEEIQHQWSVELNQAFYRMESHFSGRETITKHKQLLEDVLKPLQSRFVDCLKHTADGEEEVLKCLEEMYLAGSFAKNDILFHFKNVLDSNWQPEHHQTKELELGLLTFRNFVNFNIKIYLVLISTYKKLDGKTSRLKVGYFADKMTRELEIFIKYADRLRQAIIGSYNTSFDIESSQSCHKIRATIGRGTTCAYKFCEHLHHGSNCEIDVTVFQKENIEGSVQFQIESKDASEASKYFSLITAKELYYKHQIDLIQAVHKRWDREMLPIVTVWRSLKQNIRKSNERFIKEALDRQFSFKLHPNQMKNVNVFKAQIADLKARRARAQQHNRFVKANFGRDEL